MSTSTQSLPDALVSVVASQCSSIVSSEFSTLTKALVARFGASLDAVILYGSCLHSVSLDEGIADLYVIVNNYQNAYSERYLAHLNTWLTPNVFYLEVSHQEKILRVKYAVISMIDFEKGVKTWFHSYIWARFAQPSRLLYTRDAFCRHRMHVALAQAVVKFLTSTVITMGNRVVTVKDIWIHSLLLTYAAELRTERETRARHLTQYNLDNYTQLTKAAAPALASVLKPLPDGSYQCLVRDSKRQRALRYWRIRRWQGRVLSILRLSKATITFQNCLDYAAWKIKRHTGVQIEITPMLRRHPVLWGAKIMWQLLRRGVLR